MTTTSIQPSRTGLTAWPDELVTRYVARGHWQGRALGEYFTAAATASPDAIAVVHGEVRLSYRELMARADGLAVRLRELGLRPDDRIVVQLPNCWELPVVLLACFRSGVLPVLAMPAHRVHEISDISAQVQARALVVPDVTRGFEHQEMAREIAARTPTMEHVLVAGTDVRAGNLDLRRLSEPAPDAEAVRAQLAAEVPDSREVALFLLSGGTTGLPKLIARTHDDFAYYLRLCGECSQFAPDTVNLAILPMSHNFQLGSVLATLLAGGRVVLGPTPEAVQSLAAIGRERVTITAAVPAIVQRWLAQLELDPDVDLSSLRVLVVGGSRLSDHVAVQIGHRLNCVLQHGYGMAEGLVCTTRLDDPVEVTTSTQGRPMSPDDELLVVGEDGAPVPPGMPGVLLTRGPYTPRGYYRAEEYNRRAFTPDGWYRTGDIVRIRPDGNLVIEGREKDLINRGGEKISAEEVENFAHQVPGVVMAAAVAMPDTELGERICLYLVCGPDAEVTLADVRTVMQQAGVARFKLPERLVAVDVLPLTNIGKIDKKALRADIEARTRAEAGAPAAASLAGTWALTSHERSGDREDVRTGTFTFGAGGGGTLETSTGFRGGASWSQDGTEIRLSYDHDLPRGWQVRGWQQGRLDGDSWASSGRLAVFDADGTQVKTLSAQMSAERESG